MRLVVLPQALRVIIPPLTNQYLNLTKNSSLAVAIGYPDVVSIANTTLNQTGRAVECIAIIMAVYLTHIAGHLGADELVQRAASRSRSAEMDDWPTPSSRSPRAAPPVRTGGAAAWLRAQPLRRLAQRARDRASWSAWPLCVLPPLRLLGGGECGLAPNADACQAARGSGACWGVVAEKWRADHLRPLSLRRAVAPG